MLFKTKKNIFLKVVSRIGTIIGPYLLLVGHYSPLALGLGALSAGLLSLMLPETLGPSLPETLEDGEKFGLVLPDVFNGLRRRRCRRRSDEIAESPALKKC